MTGIGDPDRHIEVEPRFRPTWEELFDLWMTRNDTNGGTYANFAERFEQELGFLAFMQQYEPERAARLVPRAPLARSSAGLSTPEGNRP